jgi:hypothetical protein
MGRGVFISPAPLSPRHQYCTVLYCLFLINQSSDPTTGGAKHRYRCVIESLDKKYNEDAIKQARKGCLWDAPNEMMHGAIIDAKDSWPFIFSKILLLAVPQTQHISFLVLDICFSYCFFVYC